MTLEETNPGVDRFFSSLALRKTNDQGTSIDRVVEDVTSNIFRATEVTRRAMVVWKSEPFYTSEARAHRVVGTVSLEAVLAEDGYVTNITVTNGLQDGLTEAAIDAARNIRFFPAEKDGRPVSQRVMLEYGFNLY
jgi:TonB family protein